MPLEPPILDTRTYDTLRAEALRRAVRYTPEWTDHNVSDPGVTLLELCAWYTELLFYELNRVPELNYVKFLGLLGMELTPPLPATADVTFTVGKGASAGSVPARAQVTAANPAGGVPLVFETEDDLDLVGLEMSDVQVFDGIDFAPYTEANDTAGTTFPVFGWRAAKGCALLVGFSPPQGAPVPTPPFPSRIALRVFAAPGVQAGAVQAGAVTARPPVAPVTLVWEYRPTADPTRWQRVEVISDDTAGFTRDGYVVLSGPRDAAPTPEGHIKDDRYWLRCRIASEDTDGYAVPPQVDVICANTVPVTNLATVTREFLGQSAGEPGQTFTLRHAPVTATSLTLDVVVPDAVPEADTETWARVDDFLGSGPDAAVYTLDAVTGMITFPDGRNGRILPAGATVTAAAYRYGGGAAGNVDAGAISGLGPRIAGVTAVTNQRPAVGGADEQTVDDAGQRAPAILRANNRAVTEADFAAVAMQAGDVAKATAIGLHHPDYPGVAVPGAVTVVIVPGDSTAPDPTPSQDLVRAVAGDLDAQRLLTTEVFVAAPDYQAIAVAAGVLMSAGHTPDEIAGTVGSAIDTYLDPLLGGSDGCGWSFGTSLIPTNLYAVIGAVPGVTGVLSLTITVDGRDHPIDAEVTVPATGLLYGADHSIVAQGAAG
jgi:predicted phage baseplate assembly protein